MAGCKPSRRPTAGLPENTLTNPAVLCRIGTLSLFEKPVTMRHKTGCGITGDPSPSQADLRLTRRINEASRILQLNLIDHVIIGSPAPGRSSYFSFKEGGIIS